MARIVIPLLLAGFLPACLPAAAPPAGPLEVLVLYDNAAPSPGLKADWGFSALVRFRGRTVLFDSGADPAVLAANMWAVGLRPASISATVISHEHADHLNGVYRVMSMNRIAPVYFLDTFPGEAFRRARLASVEPKRVTGPVEIVPGIYSTGVVPGEPGEQALVIETSGGIVILTGCSHPRVVRMVETALAQHGGGSVRLLVGGFHMLQQTSQQAGQTAAKLQQLNVRAIVPTHCTGEAQAALIRSVFGARAGAGGAGKRIVLD